MKYKIGEVSKLLNISDHFIKYHEEKAKGSTPFGKKKKAPTR